MAEKKLEVVSFREEESFLKEVDGLARIRGMCRSEWYQETARRALKQEKDRYLALHSIFGQESDTLKENKVSERHTPSLFDDPLKGEE